LESSLISRSYNYKGGYKRSWKILYS
jgi:hypothetical protein